MPCVMTRVGLQIDVIFEYRGFGGSLGLVSGGLPLGKGLHRASPTRFLVPLCVV